MKKINLIAAICLVCVGVLLSTACPLPEQTYDTKFVNNSTQTVLIENLKGTDTTTFTLLPGVSKTVEITSDTISFDYSPANLVTADLDKKKYKVTFTDL